MRRVVILLLAMTLCAAVAVAEPPDPAGVVARVLELSDGQITSWVDLLHAREAAVRPLAEQAQAQQQAIAQALAGGNADPLTVGKAVMALDALQKQIGAANAQSVHQFEELLTPDQLQRLNGIRGAAQVCPIVPAFQATGLLPPPMH